MCQTFLSQELNSKKTETDISDEVDQGVRHDNLHQKEEEINQINPKSKFPPVDLFLQSKKTLSSLVLDSEFYENMQIVRNFIE